MAELSYNRKTLAFAGYVSIAGAISMLIGAALLSASGTDLWETLASHQMEGYLKQLEPVKHLLVANTAFWMLGVLLMGAAGKIMAGFCSSKQGLVQLALVCTYSAVPVAVVAFMTMLSLAIHQPANDAAYVIGWIGAQLDNLATMLIVGMFPLLISLAGRNDWVPKWLLIWGGLAGVTGLLSIISMLTGIVALGFIIIPVGLGWMIATGVVLIRKGTTP